VFASAAPAVAIPATLARTDKGSIAAAGKLTSAFRRGHVWGKADAVGEQRFGGTDSCEVGEKRQEGFI
jgi:hypothetical protein